MRTILLDLPPKCRGYIYEDVESGERLCVLNSRLTYESNQKTYEHESRHLINEDFDSYEDINSIENRTHALNK